ncbi:MAG: hypothetical protein IPN06_14240 [Burkholderiales bacterium]|nr:hypothetical protein [Burkholderiales bacterium]
MVAKAQQLINFRTALHLHLSGQITMGQLIGNAHRVQHGRLHLAGVPPGADNQHRASQDQGQSQQTDQLHGRFGVYLVRLGGFFNRAS